MKTVGCLPKKKKEDSWRNEMLQLLLYEPFGICH